MANMGPPTATQLKTAVAPKPAPQATTTPGTAQAPSLWAPGTNIDPNNPNGLPAPNGIPGSGMSGPTAVGPAGSFTPGDVNTYNYLGQGGASALQGLLGNAPADIALAQNQMNLSNQQLNLTGQEGLQNINEQQLTGNENIYQQQLANQLSQQGLNTQEYYDPLYFGIQQQQYGLQGQGLGLQQQGIQQQTGEAKNTLQQQLLSNYGNAAASGSTNTSGAQNNYNQAQYNYQQQLENLQRQSQQVGLQQKGLGLSEKQSTLQYGQQQAGLKQQQESINNVAQRIGFSQQDLTRRIGDALNNLGISQNISAGQIAQAYNDTLGGIANPLASILPYILQSGNIPNLLSGGLGGVTGGVPGANPPNGIPYIP